jgi:hypothetical protein
MGALGQEQQIEPKASGRQTYRSARAAPVHPSGASTYGVRVSSTRSTISD